MNLQRDFLHQGSPYLHSQEALSVPSKALKPKKPRSSSRLPHRNHFSLHSSSKHRNHLVCASFERAIIISPGRWAVAAQRWSRDWSALFFWAIPTTLEIALESGVIIWSREVNRRFLIIKWKSGKALSSGQKQKLLILRKGVDGKKKMIQQRCFGLRRYPIKRTFFSICLLAMLGAAPGNNRISVSVWLLSELLSVQLLFTTVCYNFLTPSHIPYE